MGTETAWWAGQWQWLLKGRGARTGDPASPTEQGAWCPAGSGREGTLNLASGCGEVIHRTEHAKGARKVPGEAWDSRRHGAQCPCPALGSPPSRWKQLPATRTRARELRG